MLSVNNYVSEPDKKSRKKYNISIYNKTIFRTVIASISSAWITVVSLYQQNNDYCYSHRFVPVPWTRDNISRSRSKHIEPQSNKSYKNEWIFQTVPVPIYSSSIMLDEMLDFDLAPSENDWTPFVVHHSLQRIHPRRNVVTKCFVQAHDDRVNVPPNKLHLVYSAN